MNATITNLVTVLLLLSGFVASAQVSSTAPKHWKIGSPVDFGISRFGVDHKLRDTVRDEILDTNTIQLIAQSIQLSDHDKTLFLVAPEGTGKEVWFYTLSNEWSEGCSRFADRLSAYVRARMDGHTRACLLAGLTNHTAFDVFSNPDLLILSTRNPILPVSWFHKAESGTVTNKAGQVSSQTITRTIVDGKMQSHTNTHAPRVDEVCRWVTYTMEDGDIGWRSVLYFAVDGTLDSIHTSKCDVKEFNPKFQKIFEEVDSEVKAEMKQNGTFGHIGSVHTYWRLKKEKLKARGIDWRSPKELNPETIYD